MLPGSARSDMGTYSASWAQSVHLPLRPHVPSSGPAELHPGLSSGGKSKWSSQERKVTSSLGPHLIPAYYMVPLLSPSPPRQTQSPRGFSCDPLLGVCLGPWALAHGYGLDSVAWQSQSVTGLGLPGPLCPCVLPEVALSVPPPPYPSPGSTHTRSTLDCRVPHTPLLGQSRELLLTPGTHRGFSLGRSPPALKP